MTLSPDDRYKSYSPLVLTTDFLLDFPLFDPADIEVRVDNVAIVAFSVSATFTNGRSDDAKIVLVTAVSGVPVEIYGKRIPRRDNSYAAGSPELAENLQRDIEATTAVQQEQGRDFGRSILLPIDASASYELPTTRADRVNTWLGFDGLGDPMVGAPGGSGYLTTAFMATVLDDPDAATARATLGAGDMNDLSDDLTPQLGGPLATNGKPIDWSQGADVASAAELLVLRDGNSFNVTGADAIAGIETTADAWPIGSVVLLKFTGAATLTQDAASFPLIGGANITVAAGDWAVFRKFASVKWEMASFCGLSATADWEAGTSTKPSLASPANVKAAVLAGALTPFIFKQNMAITSGSAFTDISGGHDPLFYKCYLTCLTAEQNFPVGAVLPVYPNQNTDAGGVGFTIYVGTATGSKLYGYFGSAASVFQTLSQSTGATVSLTNANWDLTIIAYE